MFVCSPLNTEYLYYMIYYSIHSLFIFSFLSLPPSSCPSLPSHPCAGPLHRLHRWHLQQALLTLLCFLIRLILKRKPQADRRDPSRSGQVRITGCTILLTRPVFMSSDRTMIKGQPLNTEHHNMPFYKWQIYAS